jgi:hypothetical protein
VQVSVVKGLVFQSRPDTASHQFGLLVSQGHDRLFTEGVEEAEDSLANGFHHLVLPEVLLEDDFGLLGLRQGQLSYLVCPLIDEHHNFMLREVEKQIHISGKHGLHLSSHGVTKLMDIFFPNLNKKVVGFGHSPKQDGAEVVETVAEILSFVFVEVRDHVEGEIAAADVEQHALELRRDTGNVVQLAE